jgi:hypothetical protein
MKTKIIYRLTLIFAVIPVLVSILYADTILLSDGTYLVGKVVEWDAYHIIFKNSHGAFAIKKKQLVKLYVTGNQLEDIELNKTLGNVMKDEDIIKHYLAGMDGMPLGGIDREDLEASLQNSKPEFKIYGFLSYYNTYGRLAEKLPSGIGFSLGYSQSLSGFFSSQSAFWLPLIFLEPEVIFFKGDLAELDDFSIYAGPRWDIKVAGGKYGIVSIQTMAGYTHLKIKDQDSEVESNTVSFKLKTGYEYPVYDNFITSIYLSYLYIHDEVVPLTGAGVSFALSYKF